MPYHPPHTITPLILSQVAEICGQVGRLDNSSGSDQENRIRSIHSSLAIEGNTLSLDQVSAIISSLRHIGSEPSSGSDLPTDQVTDQVKKLLLALSPREEATVD